MPPISLSGRLGALWVFTAVIALSLALIIYQSYEQGPGAQIKGANIQTQKSCEEIARKYAWGIANKSFTPDKDNAFQYALLEIILDHYEAVEGGFWNADESFGPYAYPTYDGNGVKRDIPESEKPTLKRIAAQASLDQALQSELKRGTREGILYTACPLANEGKPGAVWTMKRIPLSASFAYSKLQWSLALLFVFVMVSGLGLSLLINRLIRNVRSLEKAILRHSVEDLPPLEPSGEVELNRIVNAINQLNLRFRASKAETKRLERKLAHSDRLSALGKMAAEMAHEIRNPIATIRLKFENALVDPRARMEAASAIIYDQIDRVDRLVNMLLAMTQPFEVKTQLVAIEDWIESSLSNVQKNAENKNITLSFDIQLKEWSFDPFHLARALENLLNNAVAFTPRQGHIKIRFSKTDSTLQIDIEDDGPGLSEAVRETLFQPFNTQRKEGTGLGLVVVKDIAEAHGGSIEEIAIQNGAKFRMEIPWQKS